MSAALRWFTYYGSFINKYGTILHFLVTFFIRFEEIKIKKVDEANKTTILLFSILGRTLIILLVRCVHVKTSTLTVTGL